MTAKSDAVHWIMVAARRLADVQSQHTVAVLTGSEESVAQYAQEWTEAEQALRTVAEQALTEFAEVPF